MNKELEKKYIYALGCISIYFEKKKLNDDEFMNQSISKVIDESAWTKQSTSYGILL